MSRGDPEIPSHARHDGAAFADARRRSWTTALAIIIATALGAVTVPRIERTAFWGEHLGSLEALPLSLVVGALAAAAALAGQLWPATRESAWLASNLRALAVTVGVAATLAFGLQAPRIAALTSAVILLLPLAGYLRFVTSSRLPNRVALAAAGTTTVGLLGLAIIFDTTVLLAWFVGGPIAGAIYATTGPLVLRRYRKRVEARLRSLRHDRAGRLHARATVDTPRTTADELDLDPDVIVPGNGLFGPSVAIALLLVIALVVAPGVPVGNVVRWITLAALGPLLVWSLVRRDGMVGDRSPNGPTDIRRHRAVVAHLPDARIAELDEPLRAFIETGLGRRRLARALLVTLGPIQPDLDAGRIVRGLRRAPHGWGRRARGRREDVVARLIGIGGAAHVPHQGRGSSRSTAGRTPTSLAATRPDLGEGALP